jgi:hypothetical protein
MHSSRVGIDAATRHPVVFRRIVAPVIFSTKENRFDSLACHALGTAVPCPGSGVEKPRR